MGEPNDEAGMQAPESTRAKTWKRLRLFKRWYDRYDTWSGRYDWFNWLVSFLKTKAGVAVAGATAGTVAAVGGVAVYTAVQSYTPPPRPKAVEAQRLGDSSVFFRIEGRDHAGRRGVFDVVVLDKEIGWVRGSSSEIENKGARLTSEAAKAAVLAPEVRSGLADAKEVIAVGTASQEGDPAEETARAERRAETAAGIVKDAVQPSTPVWALNLGQYREPCATCESGGTSWQRPFVVIAVRSLEPSAVMEEALKDAMSGRPNLPSPSSYSEFKLARVR